SYFFLFVVSRRYFRSTLFPYTTLFRSCLYNASLNLRNIVGLPRFTGSLEQPWLGPRAVGAVGLRIACCLQPFERLHRIYTVNGQDRKSTRLNSSHVKISYAVFCLKKKL